MAKLPPAQNWKERKIEDWNATTFRAYLADRHEELFGIPYVTNNIAAEARNIKRMYEQYGKEITKDFIDECLRQYRPNGNYRGITFFFMFSYMRERVLPKVIEAHRKRNRKSEELATQTMTADEAAEWF